jgi:predicted nuclease of predicted toxin-antitoxin system
MLRFYANENLSAVLVEALRDYGYDVLTSYEAGRANQCIPDDRVLRDATADGRCVVTFNRDDFLALHRSGMNHAGIVVCKDERDMRSQAQFLREFFEQQDARPASLVGRCLRVLRKNQRGLSQPMLTMQEY